MSKQKSFSRKLRIILEIIGAYLITAFLPRLLERLFPFLQSSSYIAGIIVYFIPLIVILLYAIFIRNIPLQKMGLKKPSFLDIPLGILLGVLMFVIQQALAFVFVGARLSFALPTDWVLFVQNTLFRLCVVALCEEIIFRGFILNRSLELTHSKIVVIAINCLLFYALHLPILPFNLGQLINLFINTILLCSYFFLSKSKSIVPLILAHGVYDICLLFIVA